MAHEYIAPGSRMTNLTVSASERGAVLTSADGTSLEVEFIQNFGWALEVRYDKAQSVTRQPFTGAQPELLRAAVEYASVGEKAKFTACGSFLTVDLIDGSFEVGEDEKIFFRSTSSPFCAHSKEISIFDGIESLRLTDLSERSPFFSDKGRTFETIMARFEYPRPEGLVLGLPGQTGEINRNGYRFQLYNTDEFNHTPARRPMYQSWPILFHESVNRDGWVGVFHDNPSRTFVDLGDFYPDKITFESITGNTRVYICTGSSLRDVSNRISCLLGQHINVPLWAFGYQQSRWSYMSTNQIRQVVQEFRKHSIPCDAMYFDVDYMDGYRVFTNDKGKFGDLKSCVSELHQSGIRAVAIVDPGVKVDPEYHAYKKIEHSGKYLYKDGQALVGEVWPGKSIYPDFFDAELREIWAGLQAEWLKEIEFDGVWNDMNEPSNFDGQNFAMANATSVLGSFTANSNLYGYSMAKASQLGWQKYASDKRTLIISRSGYPGLQQHSVIWHGDNSAWWEHLRLALDTAIQYSLAGSYYTGADVPGFTGNPSDDLAVRFFQLGAFLPMFRGHNAFFAKDKEPYCFGEPARLLILEAIRLRYSLLREWYSGFEKSLSSRASPLMPVLDADNTLIRDHVLLFDKFLVAPVMDRDQKAKLVYLPKGDWYQFGKPETRIQGEQYLTLRVDLSVIPVFVRAGSIVVRNHPNTNTAETLKNPESYDIYPDAAGEALGYWYEDDGISIQPTNVQRRTLRFDRATGHVLAV